MRIVFQMQQIVPSCPAHDVVVGKSDVMQPRAG